MKCVAVTTDGDLTVVQKPQPDPEDGEVLVETLSVGVDGTDHEVIAGGHGGFPAGEDHLILGHEAVGVVEDPNGTEFDEGDIVVPTVRRPPEDASHDFFERGEADMAPFEEVVERGIAGAHGYMAEYFTSPADDLVQLPPEMADLGHFVEPMSITEKALDFAYASRDAFTWQPESALILGDGRLGLLTLAAIADDYDRLYCMGLQSRPDPRIDIVERLGATYIDATETTLDQVADEYETMDLIFEGTGHPPHPFESLRTLAPNGVTVSLGVPGGSDEISLDGGEIQTEMVLHNKALIGSVNARAEHFEAAIDSLREIPDWFFDAYITTVAPVEDYEDAFTSDDSEIKTVVEF